MKYLFLALFIAGCHTADPFTHFEPGLDFRIISYGQADLVRPGETLKLQIKQVYRDSVLSDSRTMRPVYQPYDSTTLSRQSYKIFGMLGKGDSVIFKALTDSAFKNKRPAFVHKGDYLYTYVKVEDILGVKENIRDDMQREMEKHNPRPPNMMRK